MANNKIDLYSEDQVKRVLDGSGINIESEMDNDFMIFCPYHNNFRTPAGEVSKTKGTFFCFSCQETKDLVELAKSAQEKVRAKFGITLQTEVQLVGLSL